MLHQIDRGLMVVSWIAAALVVVLLFAGPSLVGAKKAPAKATTESGGQASGSAVFSSAGCGGCHTLKAAWATGSVGPNLDQLRPSTGTVAQIVKSGSGTMPSFSGRLSDAQITAVARYVSAVAGH